MRLHFENFVCQRERIWTFGGHAPAAPLDPPMQMCLYQRVSNALAKRKKTFYCVVYISGWFVVLVLNSVRSSDYYKKNKKLTEIPTDIPSEAREVYLQENQIRTLRNNSFSHLSQCERLNLSSNQISNIEPEAFSGLSNLMYLGLGANWTTTLRNDYFLHLSHCEQLRLEMNQITNIKPGAFRGLGNLKWLYLQNNQITRLTANMFLGLGSLEELFINNNKLTTLNANVFMHLPRPLTLSLYVSYIRWDDPFYLLN